MGELFSTVLGNLINGGFLSRGNPPPPTAKEMMENRSLARLVGEAISLILSLVAEELSQKSFSRELSSKTTASLGLLRQKILSWLEPLWIQHIEVSQERKKLERLAEIAPDFWLEQQAKLTADSSALNQIEEPNLIEYLVKAIQREREPSPEPLIPREEWERLFSSLEQFALESQQRKLTLEEIQPMPEIREKVINMLTQLFPDAVRELLENDLQRGGKAFAKLQLDCIFLILSLLQEIRAEQQDIRQQVQQLRNRIEDLIVELLRDKENAFSQEEIKSIHQKLEEFAPQVLRQLSSISRQVSDIASDVQKTQETAQKILEIVQSEYSEQDKEAFFEAVRRRVRGE